MKKKADAKRLYAALKCLSFDESMAIRDACAMAHKQAVSDYQATLCEPYHERIAESFLERAKILEEIALVFDH